MKRSVKKMFLAFAVLLCGRVQSLSLRERGYSPTCPEASATLSPQPMLGVPNPFPNSSPRVGTDWELEATKLVCRGCRGFLGRIVGEKFGELSGQGKGALGICEGGYYQLQSCHQCCNPFICSTKFSPTTLTTSTVHHQSCDHSSLWALRWPLNVWATYEPPHKQVISRKPEAALQVYPVLNLKSGA